jgi:hypothetical protein
MRNWRARSLQHEDRVAADAETAARGSFGKGGVLAWVAVGVPFCIGLYIAIGKAAALLLMSGVVCPRARP